MTVAMKFDGTIQWFRTDSYWNPGSAIVASSWGPAAALSSHAVSSTDNTTITATDQGKSWVYALSDGSGVQLAHITGGANAITVPIANTTAGIGANSLTVGATAFTNSTPNRVDENYCSDTNLLLAGVTDTSTLAATVTAFSDGYVATITMSLDWIQTGAYGGWRGVCMVAYNSLGTNSGGNGSVCMAATQSIGGGMGSDFAGSFLLHVPAATWTPPAMTGSITPTTLALTNAKYGIVSTPAAATPYIFTGGYYTSV